MFVATGSRSVGAPRHKNPSRRNTLYAVTSSQDLTIGPHFQTVKTVSLRPLVTMPDKDFVLSFASQGQRSICLLCGALGKRIHSNEREITNNSKRRRGSVVRTPTWEGVANENSGQLRSAHDWLPVEHSERAFRRHKNRPFQY